MHFQRHGSSRFSGSTWAKLRPAKSWRQQQSAGVVDGMIFWDVTDTSQRAHPRSFTEGTFVLSFSLHPFPPRARAVARREAVEPGE